MAQEKEQLNIILTELGERFQLMEVTAFNEDNLWTLALNENTVIFLDLDESRDRVVFSADVGFASEESRNDLYSLVLQYNYQWRQTGGARFAIDQEHCLTLLYDISTDTIEISHIATVLQNYIELIMSWRHIIVESGKKTEDSVSANVDAVSSTAGMIRG